MRIFITGINGVLGSVLKDELRSRGHVVYGCDLAHSSDPQIVRADVTERRQLANALDQSTVGWDLMFGFAAEFGRNNGRDFYEQLWRTNLIGTQNMIEECAARKIKLVFASSSEAYGLSEEYGHGRPLSEGLLDRYPPQFHSIYALSKWTNERQITMAARNQKLDTIILRFFNVYGPPERYSPYRSVVCQFAYQLLKGLPVTVNLGGKRSHLWIGDWANTVANIADRGRLDFLAMKKIWPGSGATDYVPVFNIGGTEYESIEDLYHHLCTIISGSGPTRRILESPVRFIESENANTATKQPDCSLAETWLDHHPQMPLMEGLFRTVNWMRKEYGL